MSGFNVLVNNVSTDLTEILSTDSTYKDSTFSMSPSPAYPFYRKVNNVYVPLQFQSYSDALSRSANVNYKYNLTDIGPQCRSKYCIITPTITIDTSGVVFFNGGAPSDYTETVTIPPTCTNANIMVIGSGGAGGSSGGYGAGDGVCGSGGTFLSFNYRFTPSENVLNVTIGKPGMGVSGSSGYPVVYSGLNYFTGQGRNGFWFGDDANTTTIGSNVYNEIAKVLGGNGGSVGINGTPTTTKGSENNGTDNSILYRGALVAKISSNDVSAGYYNTNGRFGTFAGIPQDSSSYPLNLLQNPIYKLTGEQNSNPNYPVNVSFNENRNPVPLFFGSNYIPNPTFAFSFKHDDGVMTSTLSNRISYGSGGFGGKRYNSPPIYDATNYSGIKPGYYGWANGSGSVVLSGPGAAGAPGIVIIFWRYDGARGD